LVVLERRQDILSLSTGEYNRQALGALRPDCIDHPQLSPDNLPVQKKQRGKRQMTQVGLHIRFSQHFRMTLP
jgi:hypothetical protein